jgi:phosphoribosylformylglycinamidine cyclo-ligase
VRAGDAVLGLASSGLHSNGYSLARKVIEVARLELTPALADALLRPTVIYVKTCLALRDALDVHAFAHITGGGLPGNLPRVLPPEHRAVIDPKSWERPAIFDKLQNLGEIPEDEMRRTFNCGVGMCAVVSQADAPRALQILAGRGQQAWVIGRIEAAPGLGEPEVVFRE